MSFRLRRINKHHKLNHPGRLDLSTGSVNSVGRWELLTPIGPLQLERDHNDLWVAHPFRGDSPRSRSSLRLWLYLSGVSEAAAPTRRELIEIIAHAVERYPETPAQLWEARYGIGGR